MNEWNEVIEKITSNKYKFISFDIFDTLLLRPLWEPTDLFYFVGLYAKQLNIVSSEYDFMKFRRKAEEETRLRLKRPFEDITIDEIYLTLGRFLKNDSNLNLLKNREKELELHFCYKRQCGYDLYRTAIESNIKVICISDMYLRLDDINLLLEKNGYTNIERIYMSSELRLSKNTGNLYQYVKNDLGLNKEDKILHIGDNYYSDISMAQKSGIDAFYLIKAKDIYITRENNDNIKQLKHRIDNAIAANTRYDNPFIVKQDQKNQADLIKLFDAYSNDIANSDYNFIYKTPLISKLKRRMIRLIK